MGIFSRRRGKGFDPDLWSDARQRAKRDDRPGWDTLAGPAEDLDAIATNSGAQFSDDDQDWLDDDPGEQIRNRRRDA